MFSFFLTAYVLWWGTYSCWYGYAPNAITWRENWLCSVSMPPFLSILSGSFEAFFFDKFDEVCDVTLLLSNCNRRMCFFGINEFLPWVITHLVMLLALFCLDVLTNRNKHSIVSEWFDSGLITHLMIYMKPNMQATAWTSATSPITTSGSTTSSAAPTR